MMLEKVFLAEWTESSGDNHIKRLCIVTPLYNSRILCIDLSFFRSHRYKPYTTLRDKKELPRGGAV